MNEGIGRVGTLKVMIRLKSTLLKRMIIVKTAERGSVQWLIGVLIRIRNIQNKN